MNEPKRNKLLIALDADGVLVHYNKMYGVIWQECFGETLTVQDPTAYHATTYWGVENPAKDHRFWQLFREKGWRGMEAMEGAVEACQRLHDAGHTLVCVTSMPAEAQADRQYNLKMLGFPIDLVIACGSRFGHTGNPKKEAIEQLAPDWFVDDELRKLKDLPTHVQCVLVDPKSSDDPNAGQDDSFLAMRVRDLREFADCLLEASPAPVVRRFGG